ncbi:MAG: hypothetical protein IJH04_11390 [Eggerthellaceae bacterium]|nr:hypothetical protein [Eggerthellaceae bacterium]
MTAPVQCNLTVADKGWLCPDFGDGGMNGKRMFKAVEAPGNVGLANSVVR